MSVHGWKDIKGRRMAPERVAELDRMAKKKPRAFTEADFRDTLRDCGVTAKGKQAAFLTWKFGAELFASEPDEDPQALASLAALVLKDMAITLAVRKMR